MRATAVCLVLLAAALLPASGLAQATRCSQQAVREASSVSGQTINGKSVIFASNGVRVVCPSKGITLVADSAEIYEGDRVYLVGHVVYDEPRLHLDSDFLTYWFVEERIFAYQNVKGRLPTGSTMQGPQATYLRAVPRLRARSQMTAVGRPTFSIVEKDSKGNPQEPVIVVANTVLMDGDSLIYGSGDVVLTRPELRAKSDSAAIDSGKETMRLIGNPDITGTKSRPYTLKGDVIDLYSRNRKLQRVISRSKAIATSQDLNLRADTIDLRLVNDLLERAMAWGPRRAIAVSPTQRMIADSLDVRMPKQRVREVHALRKAFAEGRPDSTKFRADTTDWMRGDTIIAFFDSTAQVDTTKGPAIQQLVSRGNASSYYNLPPQDTTLRRPAINYVKGRQISIDFDDQRVATVVVDSLGGGIYVEPKSDTATIAGGANRTPAPPANAPANGPRTTPAPPRTTPTTAPQPARPIPTSPRRPPE